jgi:hypothetical protein
MASDTSTEAELLQSQMRQVRASLREDVKVILENARDMTDWQYYVKRYPWACLGAAAALGFLIVPSRTIRAAAPAPSSIMSGLGSNSTFPSAKASIFNQILGQVAGMATGAIQRAAIGIATDQLNRFLGDSFKASTARTDREDQHHVEPNS